MGSESILQRGRFEMRQTTTTALETGLPVTSIIVPFDGSPMAERAIAPARWIAARLGAEVHLLNVSPSEMAIQQHRAEITALAAAEGLSWEMEDSFDIPEAIEAVRNRLSPAIVCMATHSRARNAVFVNSVTSALLHHSALPALLVGPQASMDSAAAGRLVVCVDGTAGSEALIPVAAAWASALGLATSVVTVAEPVPESVRRHGHYLRMFGPDIDADRYISGLVEQCRDRIPGIDGTAIYNPVTVPGGVLEYLKTEQPALVVLGTRARAGIPRLVLGSVAASVVNGAACAALVVPVSGS
jgi:nucleotide-binding universal stress UspA family protein